MIDYIVHYTDSDGNVGTVSTNTDSTSVDISDLNIDEIYIITVEARSEHLSGESETMVYEPGESMVPHYVTISSLYSHRSTSCCSNKCES